MNKYTVRYYDRNAIDPQERDQIKRAIVNAESDVEAASIMESCDCEVIDVEMVVEKNMEEIKADYFDDYGADYQERNDLYGMGMGY